MTRSGFILTHPGFLQNSGEVSADDPDAQVANNPPEISLKEAKGLNGQEFWLNKPFQPLTHQNKSQ